MSPYRPEPLNTSSSGSAQGKWSAPVQPTPEPDTGGEALAAELWGLSPITGTYHEQVRGFAAACAASDWLADRLAEAVKAERERIAAELDDYEVQRALTNAMEDHVRGHASSNSPHSFYCDGACATQAAMFRLGIILRERAARTAPLQDAEEVGE